MTNMQSQHSIVRQRVRETITISEWLNVCIMPARLPQDVLSFLNLFPGTLYTYLNDAKDGERDTIADRTVFDPIDVPLTHGVFFSVNGFSRGKRAKERISSINALHCDFDLTKNGIPKTQVWLDDAFGYFSRHNVTPTAVVETKNGFHFYWVLKQPYRIDHLDAATKAASVIRFERALKAIAKSVEGGDMASAELAHLMRLPGTEHRKDIHLGPEHVFLCRLVHFEPKNVYTIDTLENVFQPTDMLTQQVAKPSLVSSGALEALLEGVPEHGNAVVAGRDTAATQLIGRWLGMGHSEEEVLLFAEAWNSKNPTPLPHDVLGGIVNRMSMRENVKGTAGDPIGRYKMPPRPLLLVSDVELATKKVPPIQWHVKSLFAKNTLNMIAAPPNQYKTWIVLRTAMSVARGVRLFDEFETMKDRVLVYSEEDSETLGKERQSMLLQDGEEPGGVFFVFQTGRKIDAAWAEEIIQIAKANDIGFVVLDSLRALHSEDENSSQPMQAVMDTLTYLTLHGLTVLFTQHNKKGQSGSNAKEPEGSMDMIRGSTAIPAAVYSIITCKEKRIGGHPHIIIHQPKMKGAKKLEPFELRIDEQLQPKRMSFAYVGQHDASLSAAETMESKLSTHFRDNSEDYFTRKQLVELGFAKSEDDKTLRTALLNLEEKKQLKLQKYGELTVIEQQRVASGEKLRSNTKVHRLLAGDE